MYGIPQKSAKKPATHGHSNLKKRRKKWSFKNY